MKELDEILESLDDNSFTNRIIKERLDKIEEAEDLERLMNVLTAERTTWIPRKYRNDYYDIKEFLDDALNTDFEFDEECE